MSNPNAISKRRITNFTDGTEQNERGDRPSFVLLNDKGNPYISAPLLAKYVRENLPYILVRDDGKQAIRQYVYAEGYYRLYDNNMMMGDIKKYIEDYDISLVKMSIIREVLQNIHADLDYIRQEELDADESIINFRNGLLQVSGDDISLIEHSQDVLSTIQIPCDWTGKETPTPVFDRYMHTLTDGDKAVEQLLMEFIGACISNIKGWRMKKALFMVGDGNTGKSQLKSLVERLLGSGNFCGIDLQELEARFGLSAIYGTRLAGSSDMSYCTIRELKTFKQLTGGDSLFVEFKGKTGFPYTYGGFMWFCMNRLPQFGGDDGQWVYDRIMVINCPNVIPPDQQDKMLLDKMYAERDGIVYKAVKALQTVVANGYRFSEPPSVCDARKKYIEENNTIACFFHDCMCLWTNGRIDIYSGNTTGRIYNVYQSWCRNNGCKAKNAKDFRNGLAKYLGTTFKDMTTRRNGNTYYKDYTILDDAISLY